MKDETLEECMGIVMEKLLEENKRPTVISDCARLVDGEVASKRGVTGMMIKGGYKAFKAIKPSIVTEAVDHLLDDFAKVLDVRYEEYLEADSDRSEPFRSWAVERNGSIADDLLSITDGIMDRSSKTALKKIYKGMRGVAKKNVAEAVPAIATLVTSHVGE